MDKKILRLQRKSNAIFKLFQKMIDRLLKHNEKLNQIMAEVEEELAKQNKIMDDALLLKTYNMSQISKLQSLIGKEDNNG